MLEKCYKLNIYQLDKPEKIRDVALILASLIPLFLLFSRVAADAAVTVIGLTFLIKSIRCAQYDWLKQPLTIVLLSLWLWFIFCSFFAFNGAIATSFGTSFVFVRFLFFFFACTNWLFTEVAAMRFATKVIIITLVISAADTLLQFFTGFSITGKPQLGGRLTSFLRRPDIGIYLAKLIFPIAGLWLYFALVDKNNKKILGGAVFLLVIVGIIALTGERAATILAFSALGSVLFVIGVYNKILRIYMISGVITISCIFSLIIYNTPFIYQRAIDSFNDISKFGDSLYGQLFKASILTWQEFGFFTGVGIRQFREACLPFKESSAVYYCDLHSHNIYLEILSESGLIGLILLSTFVVLCLYKIFQSLLLSKQDLAKFIITSFAFGGIFTILFPISVTMSFITNWSASLNWLGIALCMSIIQIKPRSRTDSLLL
jgi:O-antigen ligase